MMHGWASKQEAIDAYQQNLWEYHLGARWMRVAVPVILTKAEAAKARREVYAILRYNYPERFPKGYRFS